MSTRLWYPVDLIDEYLPAGRATPEAWLDFLQLSSDDMDEDDRFLSEHYAPGDQIALRWVERRGTATISINRDGTTATALRCPETPDLFTGETGSPSDIVSADINSFWDDESETYAETMEDFAREYAANLEPFDDEPQDVSVEIAVWGDKITFAISADGKSLTRVTPEEAQS